MAVRVEENCVLKVFSFNFQRTVDPGPPGVRDARRAYDHRGVPKGDRVCSDDGVGDLPSCPHKGIAEALDACSVFFFFAGAKEQGRG